MFSVYSLKADLSVQLGQTETFIWIAASKGIFAETVDNIFEKKRRNTNSRSKDPKDIKCTRSDGVFVSRTFLAKRTWRAHRACDAVIFGLPPSHSSHNTKTKRNDDKSYETFQLL